jgi:hypothetical protein
MPFSDDSCCPNAMQQGLVMKQIAFPPSSIVQAAGRSIAVSAAIQGRIRY